MATNDAASFRPQSNMEVGYVGGGGGPDPMASAIAEYQRVMAPKNTHPMENYLGGVQSQEEYRPAMLQYLSNGGKQPGWFTGNFEVDKPNIDAAINATMTPQQQMVRQEAQQKSADLQEARQARLQLAKDVELRRAQDAAQKREGMKAKISIPNRDDRLQALQVLGGLAGEKFGGMPIQAQDAAAARAAAIAKSKVGTPEAQGVDFESLLGDAYNEMLLKGELKMPQESSFPYGFMGMGQAGATANFKPQIGGGAAAPVAPPPTAATVKRQPTAKDFELLKAHPEFKEAFKTKFGYLP